VTLSRRHPETDWNDLLVDHQPATDGRQTTQVLEESGHNSDVRSNQTEFTQRATGAPVHAPAPLDVALAARNLQHTETQKSSGSQTAVVHRPEGEGIHCDAIRSQSRCSSTGIGERPGKRPGLAVG